MVAQELRPIGIRHLTVVADHVVVGDAVLGDVQRHLGRVLLTDAHEQAGEPFGLHLPAHPGAGQPAFDPVDALVGRERRLLARLAPEPLAIQPLVRTVKSLVEPRNLDYRVLLNNIDRRRGDAHLEDWENIVDNLALPRFKNHVRKSASVTDAPVNGRVVTDYTDTRQNRAAIFDYNSVALELQSIWANAPVQAGAL